MSKRIAKVQRRFEVTRDGKDYVVVDTNSGVWIIKTRSRKNALETMRHANSLVRAVALGGGRLHTMLIPRRT